MDDGLLAPYPDRHRTQLDWTQAGCRDGTTGWKHTREPWCRAKWREQGALSGVVVGVPTGASLPYTLATLREVQCV